MTTIGKPIPRVDLKTKATGESLYPGDFNRPDQLYLKILFAGRPHAIINSIDTLDAEAVDGVVGVLTAQDVPVNEYGLIIADQPVLCGPGSAKTFTDRVRFIGDQIAVVLAETEDIAEQACRKIKVNFTDLPVIGSIEEALADHAELLHPERESNNFCHYQIRHGDVDEAFKHCDVIIEGEYQTPVQEHVYLQPEAGIAYLDEEEVVRVTNGEFETIRRDDLGGDFDLRVSVSTPEKDEEQAQKLLMLMQTNAASMDPELYKMIMGQITRLQKMPDLAEKIETFEPKPDEAQIELQRLQLENARLALKTTEALVGISNNNVVYLQHSIRDIKQDLKEHKNFSRKVYQRKSRSHSWSAGEKQ